MNVSSSDVICGIRVVQSLWAVKSAEAEFAAFQECHIHIIRIIIIIISRAGEFFFFFIITIIPSLAATAADGAADTRASGSIPSENP